MAIENARRNAASVGSFARDYVLTSPIKSAGNIAMASLIFKAPMQSFLKKAAASPGALNRFAAAMGGITDRVLPEKVGPLRIVMSSKLDKEIVELTTLYSEATKDLDDVQREAFRKKYIGIANEQSKMSPEEIDELVSDIVGKKKKGKVEKTLKDQRLQLRMKQRQ
jgi:predicted Zn-dependent peptidase